MRLDSLNVSDVSSVSSEEGQVLGEQAEGPQSSERVPADAGGHQRLRLQILHPRPARHHRREFTPPTGSLWPDDDVTTPDLPQTHPTPPLSAVT